MRGFWDRLIFFPQPIDEAAAGALARPGIGQFWVRGGDGKSLHGWLVGATSAPEPLLIYFGGNAEEVSWMVHAAASFPGCGLLAMNYRGYGLSEGAPSEPALLADALAVFDAATGRPGVDPKRVGVIGRSLGSAVACHLAAHRPLRAVALVTPFDSLASVGRHHYPLLPVRWLARHRFDSLALARHLRQPLLCLVAGRDRVVPPRLARRLFDAWAGAKQWAEFADAGHDDIQLAPGFWGRLRDFFAATL
jgi:hypothetical protein